jgi:transcriptional regulator with XRE-family HTH domain
MTNRARLPSADPREVTDTDAAVGAQVRHLRRALGIKQQDLAEALGITAQQIQKYESGMNRISAGRLWQFAKFLEVPVSALFETAPGRHHAAEQLPPAGWHELSVSDRTVVEGLISRMCGTKSAISR